MMGLAKIILEASILVVLFASTSVKTIDPNTVFSSPTVKIPTETTAEATELPGNINTSNIFNDNDILSTRTNEALKIQYIPVGNGEAILITANGYTMLLDGGENLYEKQFLSYLRNAHINKLDYLIITSPVDENIGVLDGVIKNLEIDKIYTPKLTRDSTDYINLLSAMSMKNKSFLLAEKYKQFSFGDGFVTFLHVDNNNPDNIYNASIVINLEYKNKNFLFASNINKETEQNITWKKADVLKVASKGKSIASEYIFLAKVKPDIAVIIQDDEDYDPKIETNIKKLNGKVLFADKNKVVQITYDGTDLKEELVQNTIY